MLPGAHEVADLGNAVAAAWYFKGRGREMTQQVQIMGSLVLGAAQ